jgi:hypothetical protein
LPDKNRKAIIVGVNEYQSRSDIDDLAGAEMDAKEIHEQFTRNGNFEVSSSHLLIGPDATRANILRAVGDIFKSDESCDLVAFYFSGHGMIDENKEGYIAPYDMDPKHPYIYGINMEDLRKFMSTSKNKASAIIFLDCCYAGIATQGERSIATTIPADPEKTDVYAKHLQNMVQPFDELSTEDVGRGNIVLASSEATAVSREKNNCIHLGREQPHTHGAFSFHLIEGLDGSAADPDTGVVTIDSLRSHIEKQMKLEGRQRPMYRVTEGTDLDSIRIATSLIRFNEKIEQLIKSADELCSIKYPNSDLIDIQSLADAAKMVGIQLSNLDPNNRNIPRFHRNIDDALDAHSQPTIDWLTNNMKFAKRKIDREIKPGQYYELRNKFEGLSFDSLQKIDQKDLYVLIYLCDEVSNNTIFRSENDPRLDTFVQSLRAAIHIGATKK